MHKNFNKPKQVEFIKYYLTLFSSRFYKVLFNPVEQLTLKVLLNLVPLFKGLI